MKANIVTIRVVPFWLLLTLVGLLPFAAYAPALIDRYGFRDDYSTLRESQDDLRTTLNFCASQGRPLYGFFLARVCNIVGEVDNLGYLRAIGVGLASAVAILMAWALHRRIGLQAELAAAVGLLVALLPSAQVKVAWAICGLHIFGGVFGLGAFLLADASVRKRFWPTVGAVILVTSGALFYQSDVMLYLVPVAAAGIFYQGRHDTRWALRHGMILFGGLALAFVVIKLLFATGIFLASKRASLEVAPLTKMAWYAQHNLQEAFGLFVVRDVVGRTVYGWTLVVSLSVWLTLWGGWSAWRRGRATGGIWFGALVLGLVLAGSVTLIASERWATYRTLWALAAVVWLLVLRPLLVFPESLRRLFLVSCVIVATACAYWNTRYLFAEPQAAELAIIEQAALRVAAFKSPRVLLILEKAGESRAPLRWLDEFGSNSSDCEWSPKEMLRVALRSQGAAGVAAERAMRFKSSLDRPVDTSGYDVVIDMRLERVP
jgi:hypothetical protein